MFISERTLKRPHPKCLKKKKSLSVSGKKLLGPLNKKYPLFKSQKNVPVPLSLRNCVTSFKKMIDGYW